MQVVDTILTQAAEVFRCTVDELVGRSRKRPLVEARQATMWAIRQRYPSLSLETIGTAVGRRHYTTVMHALTVVEARAKRSATYRGQLQRLMARLSRPLTATSAAAVALPHRSAVKVAHTAARPTPH